MVYLIKPAVLAIITLRQEATGEPFDGKVAVAEVILRRSKDRRFSDGTVEGAILKPYAFSGWNANDPGRIRSLRTDSEHPETVECVRAWEKALAGSDLSGGATHYYNPKGADPGWAKHPRMIYIKQIGNHRFYKELGREK